MLAPEDAGVVARHPQLPGLRLALDPDAVASEITRALPAVDVVAAHATYVRLKPPTSCLVGYRLTRRDGTDVDAYVRTGTAADGVKVHKAVAAAQRRVGTTTAALLGPGTAVLVHPSDHDLTAIARLADADQRRRLLSRALNDPAVGALQLQRLRYKPERRWVGVVHELAGRRLVLKVHRASQHRNAVAGAAAFARSPVAVACLAGSSRRHAVTVHHWVPGAPASHLLAQGAGGNETLAASIGGQLGRLHTAAPATHPRLAAQPDERDALTAGVAAIAALSAAAGRRAERIALHIADRLAAVGFRHDGTPDCPRLLHGDCSVDQFIITPHGPVLIDVDRATTGDPHSDLGQLLADLALRQVTGALTADDRVAAAVLAGYTAGGAGVDRDRLAALTAARLVRLAPEPFRHRRDRWAAELDGVLDRATAVTRDGVPG